MATATKINSHKTLSAAAQKQLLRMINNLSTAQTNAQKLAELHQAAQETEALAQAQANTFVTYLAEEMGVPLGMEGWAFDQDTMCFKQVPAKPEAPDLGQDHGEGEA